MAAAKQSGLADRIRPLVARVVESMGLELVELVLKGSRGSRLLRVDIDRGRGHFLVGLYAKGGAVVSPSSPEPPAGGEELTAQCDAVATQDAPGAKLVGKHFAGNEPKTDWYVPLEDDQCYWLVAVGEPSVAIAILPWT